MADLDFRRVCAASVRGLLGGGIWSMVLTLEASGAWCSGMNAISCCWFACFISGSECVTANIPAGLRFALKLLNGLTSCSSLMFRFESPCSCASEFKFSYVIAVAWKALVQSSGAWIAFLPEAVALLGWLSGCEDRKG